MVKVNKEETAEVIAFLNQMKVKQEEYAETEDICYSKLSLYLAAKNKIFFSNLLLHPLVLTDAAFYETKTRIKASELENLLNEVIVFELTEDYYRLTAPERDRIITLHKRLKLKREHNERATSV